MYLIKSETGQQRKQNNVNSKLRTQPGQSRASCWARRGKVECPSSKDRFTRQKLQTLRVWSVLSLDWQVSYWKILWEHFFSSIVCLFSAQQNHKDVLGRGNSLCVNVPEMVSHLRRVRFWSEVEADLFCSSGWCSVRSMSF